MSNHDASKSFPALAPGPPRNFTPQTQIAVSKAKKNSTACLACKAAKRKCSGPPNPCKACISAGAENECHFDPSRDLRRKVAVKRTIKELTDYKDLFDSLLSAIRAADSDKLERIVGLVKDNGSLHDIACAVGSPVTRFTDSKVLSATSLSITEDMDGSLDARFMEQEDARNRRPSDLESASSMSEQDKSKPSPQPAFDPYARVSLENLCDLPLFNVPAKPWTEITIDNDLASHLVSLYFTWDHPCAQFLDQRIFLEHMKRGLPDSEFCSPVLVNAILAVASAYSDRSDVLSDSENTFSRGQKFFAETERLLRAEEGAPRLTTVQALLLMCCVLFCQGKGNMSWLMLGQAIHMGKDLGLFRHHRNRNSKHNGKRFSREMEKVRTITAWAIFSLDIQISTKLQKDPSMVQPLSNGDLGIDNDFDWIPYPRSNQASYATNPARLPLMRTGLTGLTEINIRIHELFDDENLREDFRCLLDKAEVPYTHLEQWLVSWPDASQIGQQSTPQVIVLRIHCLHTIMSLLEGLIERDEHGNMVLQLRQSWRKYAVEITQCLRCYRVSYGLRQIPGQLVGVVQSALHALVYQLEESEEARYAFIELSHIGVGLSQRFKSIADSINTILSLSQRGTARLPHDAIAILDGTELRGHQEAR
ncbi:Transcription factor [Penicillium malachiteum]|uniref:Transcription factor n=1 Tax=Penicillium malachiteum TaxID=1324776 RepID=A0AAD6HV87_9EURO|nr:Transcription factor [Penicillium malachiteum]